MDSSYDPTKETVSLLIRSGIAKTQLSLADLVLKSFLAGAFLSYGAIFSLLIAGGGGSFSTGNEPISRHTYLQLYVPNGLRHSRVCQH